MRLSLSKWRGLAGLLGIPSTLIILVVFLVGLFKWDVSLIYPALALNYFISIFLSIRVINSPKKSDLFITFYLFIFLLLPCLGPFLYFLLGFDSIHGGNLEQYWEIMKRNKKHEELTPNLQNPQSLSSKVFSYNREKYGALVYENNQFKLLSTPIEILSEITTLIKNAKSFIHLEFYIFSDGLISDYILDLLREKTQEGVEVRLLVDYLGNFRRLSSRTRKKIKEFGIFLRCFNPLFSLRNKLWWQFRNHNKLIVVDGQYAFCGSCNIADEYFNITNFYFQTTELGTIISGPIVNALNSLFCSHWNICQPRFNKGDFLLLDSLSYFQKVDKTRETGAIAQLLDSAPVASELMIKGNLVQLIFSAKKSIVISTPYFYPPKDLIMALKCASSSGVSIKILVPKQTDFKNFFRSLNRQLFSDLLSENIEIYEYFGFNHEKIMIIDDELVYFGSYNWDYRALYLNFENALFVKCKKFRDSIYKFMENQFKNSHQIVYDDLVFRNRTFTSACFNIFIRIFKPFL
ncbi:cardiolipin synthase [Mycoplasma haemofelis str. Langford 1]|uniref:Cardiolipin synthase n=2 Tax=Mycoplasma haemofelis TaxID=29501 RepID=F6FJB4_MYCHI|nr:phospholipase D-like domain-containing protein [Mycoplasma haemofelis]AEG72333.1 cardiolipin synthase [Mycoplasma haemofelis Ohio2]CBY92019.1 cardiolipin synthase [Mycoplasma haemofelis str. Langford 1]